jgi:hypothetical protein
MPLSLSLAGTVTAAVVVILQTSVAETLLTTPATPAQVCLSRAERKMIAARRIGDG